MAWALQTIPDETRSHQEQEGTLAYAQTIGRLIRGGDEAPHLTESEAEQLGGTILDGGVPELELGALLAALRSKGIVLDEWLGFHRALVDRVHRLKLPETAARPMVLSSHTGAVHEANLLPLLALLLT